MAFRTDLLKKTLTIILILTFLIWATWYISNHFEEFIVIRDVHWPYLVALYFTFLALLYCSGLYIQLVLRPYGLRLGWKESFCLSIASTAANFFLFFRGGAGLRAVYLKSKYTFRFSDFISTLSAMYIMNFIVNGLLGLIGLAVLVYNGKPFDLPFAVFFLVSALLSTIVISSGIQLPEYQKFPFREISRIINGWKLLSADRALMFYLMANTFIYSLLIMLQTQIAFSSLGVDLSLGGVIFYTAGRIPVSLATITPGALGFLEVYSVYMGETLNYTSSQGLLAQALIRVVSITSLLVLGPIAMSFLGIRKKHNKTI